MTVLVRSWRTVLGIAIVFGLLALAFCLLQKPVYEATTTLYVTSGTDQRPSTAYEDVMGSQNRVNSYVRLAYSDAVLAPALKTAGMDIGVDQAKAAISAQATPETVLLTIGARNTDPQLAQRLANAVADAMIDRVAVLEVPTGGGQPSSRLTTLDQASVDPSPVTPTTLMNVVLGLLVGLFVGVTVALTRERLNKTVRDDLDVEKSTDARVLARIPYDQRLGDAGTVDFRRAGNAQAVAFRHLGRTLSADRTARPLRKLVVTSPRASDGKTTVAVNLAVALTEGGDSVVIVDAALNDPAVADLTGGRDAPGLADVITRKSPLSEAVNHGTIDKLAVVGAGRLSHHNAAALLGSRACGSVLDQLAERFAYVIVDAGPTLDDADAEAVARWADAVVLVVRQGRSTTSDLEASVQRLSDGHSTVAGVVLNDNRAGARPTPRPTSAAVKADSSATLVGS